MEPRCAQCLTDAVRLRASQATARCTDGPDGKPSITTRKVSTIMKSSRMTKGGLAAVLAAGMLAAVPAAAQTTTGADAWQLEITPYAWLVGLKGTSQIGNFPTTSTDMSASDVIDH